MLELHAIKGPTGRLLREMLREKHLLGGQIKGVVNYGFHGGGHGLPTLNEHAGQQNKYQELVKLDDAGVRTIPFSRSAADLKAPIFGRKFHHTRGTDIFIYGVRPLLRGDHLSDYYTQQVAKAREYRVWVYRDKILGVYEKTLQYPEKHGRRGRSKEVWNWANGFAYNFVQAGVADRAMKDLCVAAVKALELDFGAVDVIEGTDGWYYVLEVNTAPGVEGRRQCIVSLVNHIERWATGGFQARG